MDIGLSVLPAYNIVYEICYIFYNVKKSVNMIASQVIHKYIYYIYMIKLIISLMKGLLNVSGLQHQNKKCALHSCKRKKSDEKP
jgi:hypothetical protein